MLLTAFDNWFSKYGPNKNLNINLYNPFSKTNIISLCTFYSYQDFSTSDLSSCFLRVKFTSRLTVRYKASSASNRQVSWKASTNYQRQ